MARRPSVGNGIEERRRSKRLPLAIPVRVYGRTPDNQPFRDVTVTRYVSAHGGILPLAQKVELGQTILLVNSFTEQERECRVVYVEPRRSSRIHVAVEFTDHDHEDFWHVYPARIGAYPLISAK